MNRVHCFCFEVLWFVTLWERGQGTVDTCPHFHFVNYPSVVINQLIIMTNRNRLQLVLINMTNQIEVEGVVDLQHTMPQMGPTFTPPSSTTHPVSPTEINVQRWSFTVRSTTHPVFPTERDVPSWSFTVRSITLFATIFVTPK